METQSVINAAFGIVGALMGGIMKAVWDSLKELQIADKAIIHDVSQLQILVAGAYLRREDFDKTVIALFAKLDKIDAKLDAKADKADCDKIHRGGQ
jgi:hypothetical protein